jgi:hypothetical protein
LTWPKPVFGTYTLVIAARSSVGLTTQVSATINIAKSKTPVAPLLVGSTFSVKAGSPFMTTVSGTDLNGGKLSYTLAGAPAGMTISAAGSLSWSKPIRGNYNFMITALTSNGTSTSVRFTLTVN